ncbi:hypothetical protein HDU76_009938 [Blyttiomyces sp. JEL0837]|nr:hypothetical protein HDU76_009938 [Blyttiomyces sp. JEL0837]
MTPSLNLSANNRSHFGSIDLSTLIQRYAEREYTEASTLESRKNRYRPIKTRRDSWVVTTAATNTSSDAQETSYETLPSSPQYGSCDATYEHSINTVGDSLVAPTRLQDAGSVTAVDCIETDHISSSNEKKDVNADEGYFSGNDAQVKAQSKFLEKLKTGGVNATQCQQYSITIAVPCFIPTGRRRYSVPATHEAAKTTLQDQDESRTTPPFTLATHSKFSRIARSNSVPTSNTTPNTSLANQISTNVKTTAFHSSTKDIPASQHQSEYEDIFCDTPVNVNQYYYSASTSPFEKGFHRGSEVVKKAATTVHAVGYRVRKTLDRPRSVYSQTPVGSDIPSSVPAHRRSIASIFGWKRRSSAD